MVGTGYEEANRNACTEPAMRKFAALSLIAASLALSACNTVAGVGRDLQAAGQAVTGASNDARR